MRPIKGWLVSAISVILSIFLTLNSEGRAEEKWLTGVGTAAIAGSVGPETARQLAIAEARNAVVSQQMRDVFGTDLLLKTDSGATVAEFYQKRISSRVYGRILEESVTCDSISTVINRDGRQSFIQWICLRAKVFMEESKGPSRYEPTVRLDRQSYEAGDHMTIEVFVKESSYLHIFSVAADGTTTVLYPRSVRDTVRIDGGSRFTFPNGGGILAVWNSPGRDVDMEEIRVVATKRPLRFAPNEIDSVQSRPGFAPLPITKSVNLEYQLIQLPFEDRGEAFVSYTIKAKSQTSR